MFVKLKLNENLAIGTVVSYNSENDYWSTASNDSGMIGVVGREAVQNTETLQWTAAIYFSGTVYAIADRSIPDQGGNLCVSNGRVFVDNSMPGCGIVAPKIEGQDSRIAGELIMVHLR